MTFCNAKFVERSDDVEFGVNSCVAESVKRFADEWKRVSILNGDIVESAVVLADAYPATGFCRKEKGCSTPGFGLSDEPFVKIVVKPLADDIELHW